MQLFLIRHALPVRVEDSEGPADPGLAPEGIRQAAQLAAGFAGEHLDAIVSSPLLRALQTAEPLALARSEAVEARDELAEFDRNSSWYVPMEELRAAGDPRWNAIIEGRWQEAFGVDFDEFRRAAVQAVESVVADHQGGSVAVVTHGAVLNAYVAHVAESTRFPIFEPRYTSVTRILAARSGERMLESLNETFHLRSSRKTGSPGRREGVEEVIN
jgi:probable phosphoglycerate mutase